MKILTNLPGNLRALFGILRVVTIVLGAFWFAYIVLLIPLLGHFKVEHGPYITIGDVVLRTDPETAPVQSGTAKAADLAVGSLRASLQANVVSHDGSLRSAMWWTIIPYMTLAVVTAYVLLTALRNLCANLEKGEVFNDENLRLVRRVGLTLVGSSLLQGVLMLVASLVMTPILREHSMGQAGSKLLQLAGIVRFELPDGTIPVQAGLIAGCLVLVLAEAFRQGLNLKTENDLTV